jgi:hypothetical protein
LWIDDKISFINDQSHESTQQRQCLAHTDKRFNKQNIEKKELRLMRESFDTSKLSDQTNDDDNVRDNLPKGPETTVTGEVNKMIRFSSSSKLRTSYTSQCKALLVGIGADEQMAGILTN